jgi:hypothetical protein
MKVKLVSLISISLVVLAIVGVYFGYIFTSEHRVDVHLRNYAINLNLPNRFFVTANYSDLISESVTRAGEDTIVPMLEVIMPVSHHNDILNIYNQINDSNYQNLPELRSIFDNYTIYGTQLQNFHGVDVTEGLYCSSGEFIGSPASFEIYSFFLQTNLRAPRLGYILVRRLHLNTDNILPIDMDKEEFILYYESLVSEFIENRCCMSN